jgi:HK97 gp10 family phage protein
MSELVHVKGLDELQKLLDTLPAKIERNIMRGALRKGATVLKNAAVENISSHSGDLAKSLKVFTKIKGGTVMARIVAGHGFGKKGMPAGNLPRWVEFGTQPHWIKVDESSIPGRFMRGRGGREPEYRKYSLRTVNRMAARGSLRIGTNFIGQSVAHPGATPKPFLRPALDAHASDAVEAAGEYIKNRLATKEGLDTADIVIEGDE